LVVLLASGFGCASHNLSERVRSFVQMAQDNPARVAERTPDVETRALARRLGGELSSLATKLPQEGTDNLIDAGNRLNEILGKQPCAVDVLGLQWELVQALKRQGNPRLDDSGLNVDATASEADMLAGLSRLAKSVTTVSATLILIDETMDLLFQQLGAATDISIYDDHWSRLAAWQLIMEMRVGAPRAFRLSRRGKELPEKLKENLRKEEDPKVKARAQPILTGLE
jgi:hypothetical protein